MPKKEKQLLKYITTHYDIGADIDTRDIYDKLKMPPNDVDSICDYLNQQGLFSDYVQYQNGGRAFSLTYSLFAYKKNTRNERLKYVLSSIVVPIAVGVISSVASRIILSSFW
ncbi:MAG: hypothetical protein NC120_12950 [Ruminococcus sp.]|nr:hypothetical protein [Ruminococcus sp.]